MQDNTAVTGNSCDYGDKQVIDLYGVAEDIRREWISILLISATAGMLAFFIIFYMQLNSYTSTAKVAVVNDDFLSNVEMNDSMQYLTGVASNVKNVIESGDLKDAVAQELGYTGFKGNVTVTLIENTNLFTVAVESDSPSASYLEVMTIVNDYSKFAGELSGGTSFFVVDAPVVQKKHSDMAGPLKLAVVFAVAVLIIMCCVLAYISYRKDAVHNGLDVVNRSGAAFLGGVRRVRGGNSGNKTGVLITDPDADPLYREGIYKLAARTMKKMAESGQKVLLLTGTEKGEESSSVAANLAIALSQLGHKATLTDMNFSDPSLYRMLGAGSGAEDDLLTLIEENAADNSAQAGARAAASVRKVEGTNLQVLLTGRAYRHAVDEYEEVLRSVVNELKKDADIVIINAASLKESFDAITLTSIADTSVLVVRRNRTTTGEMRTAVDELGGAEHILGCVVDDMMSPSFGAASVTDKTAQERGGDRNLINPKDTDDIVIDIPRLIKGLGLEIRRYCAAILAVTVLFGAVLYLREKISFVPSYTATATFAVNCVDSVKYKYVNQKNATGAKVALILPNILSDDLMANAVKEDLGYDQSLDLPAAISAATILNSNVVNVKVSANDPQTAYDVLQSVLRNCSESGEKLFGTMALEIMEESGVPTEADNASAPKKMAAIGLVLGLFLSLAALFVKLIIRETVLSEDDIAWMFNTKCVGRIPWIKSQKYGKGKGVPVLIDSPDIPHDFEKSVRAVSRVIEREAEENNAKVILVTSALDSEGKTAVAENAALVLAGRRRKVVLADADLHKPSAGEMPGTKIKGTGISDILSGKGTLDEALTPYEGRKNLTVLAGGDKADNPVVLWSGDQAAKMMRDLREQYDLVIIDAPQSCSVSDNYVLAQYADACVFVIRGNYARIDEICEGVYTFEGSGCRFLGYVLRN